MINKDDMNSITRDEYTLSSLAEAKHQFCVPLYQRLYSWEQLQVTQLLKDLHEAQTKNTSKDYYIGNIVLSKNKDYGFDLIDGQQRMTTLWLVALVLSKMCTNEKWKRVLINTDSKLRLQFSVREAENIYLKELLEKSLEDLSTKNTEVNRRIIDAINVIHKFFKGVKPEKNLPTFADYIFNHAKLVATILPSNMDLNKYFEVMNNRGVQLEKHEILKAQLLSQASKMQLSMSLAWLAKAWDACAQMNQYVESSFTTKDKAQALDDIINNKSSKELAAVFDANGENGSSKETTNLTLTDLQKLPLLKSSNVRNTPPKNSEDKYRSVVQFPEFLLHILKLYLKQNGSSVSVKIKDSNLLVEFANLPNDNAEAFICFLLKTRVLFDNYVIKYREVDARDIRHDISELKQTDKDKNVYSRTASEAGATRELSMLQGMLNVSTESEHWLTPLLAFLHHEPKPVFKDVTVWLESLDNVLANTRLNGAGLLDTANLFINNPKIVHSQFFDLKQPNEFYEKLNQGTDTPRYWFFRLDYLLWKSWFSGEGNKKKCGLQQSWQEPAKDFQFRQNRSVEHVYPQNPEGGNNWDSVTLDGFGNLALISVESNSGYNNQIPVDKRSDFKAKVEKTKTLESLKLALIYNGDESWNWNQETAEAHQKICCDILIDSLTKKDGD